MATISSRQAEALAAGFLDEIGSSKSEFRPVRLYSEFFLIISELIEDAQDNLNKAGLVASGKGSKSIVAKDPEMRDGIATVDIAMAFYLQFHNKGVKGTRSGKSNAGYSFKNEYVSKNMYNAIAKWIGRARRSVRTLKANKYARGYSTYGKHETQRRKISEYDSVYAKARSIKMYGLKPTGFLDKAMADAEQKIAERLGAALIIDVQDGLKPRP